MGYENILKFSIVPTILLLLLSFISIIITTHYWILGDWIMGRWVPVASTFPEKAKNPIDDVVVDWTDAETNATITSGCLNLTAAVMAIIAWVKLKRSDLDSDFNAPLRRFWVASVYITGIAGAIAGIASVALHYTERGDDKWGCTTTTGKTILGAVPFTNLLCTRESGACNFIAPNLKNSKKSTKYWAANLACNETIFVKWLQIILALVAVIIMGMFATQARLRTKTRWSRHLKGPIPMHGISDPANPQQPHQAGAPPAGGAPLAAGKPPSRNALQKRNGPSPQQ